MLSADDTKKTQRRARPPKWTPEAESVFFRDAFQEALSGERPAPGASANMPSNGSNASESASAVESTARESWSRIISASTLEDEIKSIKNDVDRLVSTPDQFRGGDHRHVRLSFGVAATVMGIVGRFDGDVRWKKHASALSRNLARTAANAKVGTIQVYQEAKDRQAELREVVEGGNPGGTTDTGLPNWVDITDHNLIMQRMEIARREKLAAWTSSADLFAKHRLGMKHESELIAALAMVLEQDGMPNADDSEYRAHCESLKAAAIDLQTAVEHRKFPETVQAIDRLSTRCDTCHQAYRD
jgi:hypothetical protein